MTSGIHFVARLKFLRSWVKAPTLDQMPAPMLLRRTDLPLVVGAFDLVVHLLGAFSASDDSAGVLVLEVNGLEVNGLEAIDTFSTQ